MTRNYIPTNYSYADWCVCRYNAYTVQAGDWGHWVLRELGTGRYPARKAVHTNMCPGAPPKDYKLTEKSRHLWIGHSGVRSATPLAINVGF